jgi:glycerophosphoryl diester phosphodiesterase
VIAHRGASGELPENTLPAYQLAIEQGADMIEIDLHRTRDGAIVVVHDEELAGLGGRGEIADASLAEVRALDAGGGERVPRLEEVLDRFGPVVAFNLELKRPRRGPYPGLEAAALEAVRLRGLLRSTLFSCFSEPVLERLRALEPAARIALLVAPERARRAVERARALSAEGLNPWFGLVTPQLVREAHLAGMMVIPYTVDDPGEMRRLLALGVDGLFTNHPGRLRMIVNSPRGGSGSGSLLPNRKR